MVSSGSSLSGAESNADKEGQEGLLLACKPLSLSESRCWAYRVRAPIAMSAGPSRRGQPLAQLQASPLPALCSAGAFRFGLLTEA